MMMIKIRYSLSIFHTNDVPIYIIDIYYMSLRSNIKRIFNTCVMKSYINFI